MPAPSYDGSVSPGLEYLRRYQTALNTYNSKQYEEAQRLFSALLAGSNANDMTDNCVYWMGEAAMQRGLTGEAIALFSNVIEYRGADKVDDALLSRASAYTREGNTAQARSDLDRLLRDFPGSEHTGMARQMLRALR
ncbi:MAG: tetratricopeptide repeat protein [Bacteroidetes bacterium]|nr:tetratricopeptide repeat protein [Bacteroidota bacterium]